MNDKSANAAIYGGYYLTLVAYLVASYFSEFRVWGFNWWAYYPDWVRWGLFGLGVIAPVVLRFFPQNEMDDSDHATKTASGDRKFFIYAGVIAAVFGGLFYLLRARTHFLGDGYTLLSELAKDSPFAMKTREYGESLLHIVLKNVIGGDGQAAALLSHQIISITAGLLFVIAVALFARKLYEHTAERVLFLLGICTGGYMLLFFGYVENYSLFVLSVLVYTLTGLLIAQGKAPRYWLLPPLVAALFFHVLGVTLIPSALYLWIGPSRLGRMIRGWRPSTKLVALIPVIVFAVVVFYHFYTTNYFFRFAFVPLIENRFTVEGYTMFSMNHLADLLNLLFLLIPGLLIVIVSLSGRSVRRTLKQRPFIYLAILISSVLGAVFIFDPKLGMPRDWDLFSFAGVPLAVLAISLLLALDFPIRSRLLVVGSTVGLAVLLLIPRAFSLANTEISLAHFEYQLLLDKLKNKNATTLLSNYYIENGNNEAARRIRRYAKETFPEDDIHDVAMSMLARGEYDQAEQILREIVEKAPSHWATWTTLGACYFYLNKPDSAMNVLDIALGLNPHGSRALNNKAAVYLKLSDYVRAEDLWLESHHLDSVQIEPLVGLVALYKATRHEPDYLKNLVKLTSRADAPMVYHRELGDYLLAKRQFPGAARAYRTAISKGLDSAYVRELLSKSPDLKRVWR